jgi:hypothetical protein
MSSPAYLFGFITVAMFGDVHELWSVSLRTTQVSHLFHRTHIRVRISWHVDMNLVSFFIKLGNWAESEVN